MGKDSGHIVSLDSLRGIAALLVVLFHLRLNYSFFFDPLVRTGYVFVDLFFVLSGFVISLNYMERIGESKSTRTFLLRRIARLWPLHIFTLFVYLGIDAIRYPMTGIDMSGGGHVFLSLGYLSEFVENFFLLHTFGDAGPNQFNGPNWSISAEFWTYVVFAFLVANFPKLHRDFLAFGLFGFCALVLLGVVQPHFSQNSDYGLFSSIYSFFIGCVIQIVYTKYLRKQQYLQLWKSVGLTLMEVALIALIYYSIVHLAYEPGRVILPFLFGILILLLSAQAGLVSWILSGHIFTFLGKISYSIYLNHSIVLFIAYPAFNRFGQLMGRDVTTTVKLEGDVELFDLGAPLLNNLALLGVLLAVIAMSTATYYLVELKGQILMRRILRE